MQGNLRSVIVTMGAHIYTNESREEHDYYATHPSAVKELLEREHFNHNVWECAAGGGHISIILENYGYNVLCTDIIDRGCPHVIIQDFLTTQSNNGRDIITNPPYKYAKEFVEHALNISPEGTKIAMLLKIQFLEGKARRKLFDEHPPKYVYVFSDRIRCSKNGEFNETIHSAMCFAWFIWVKGSKTEPIIRWI